MKILFAIKTMNTSKGGAEKVLADLTAGLADKGHKLSLLSFDPPKGQSFYPLNKKVHRIALGVGNVERRATFLEFIKRTITIRRAAKRTKPDVVIAFMHSTFIPTSFALLGTGIPVIASEHIVPQHYKDRFWEYMLLRVSLLFVKKITVLSNVIMQTYPSYLRHKMVALANPVLPPKQSEIPDKREKTILSVGRLTEQKDQKTLIAAFAKIKDQIPDWKLRIIGEGELRQELEQQIHNLGLQDSIELPGVTNEISKEYASAGIFVLPSIYESFGLATAEAMMHGLTPIGFADCPGTNEIITHNHDGLLIAAGENRTLSLADAMLELIEDTDKCSELGENAKTSIEKFHPDAIIQQWEDVINSIKE